MALKRIPVEHAQKVDTGDVLKGAGAAVPMDPLKEHALWVQWCDSRDESARDELSTYYLSYARALAARSYARRVHNEFEFAEYLHFAVVGMMEALERFKPDRGVLFKTFATPRINGAILNGLERLSERQQQVALRRRLARDRVESLSAQEPADQGDELLRQLADIGIGVALGFILEGTGMLTGAQETLPDNAYSDVETRQLGEQVWHLVDQLTDREAQVVRLHYQQQQSFDEIGMALQLTKGRISQLHRQALERLRKIVAGNGKFNLRL